MLSTRERSIWPRLTWDMALLAAPLAMVRYRQGLLSGRLRAQASAIRREAACIVLLEDTLQSAALDGYALDEKQTRGNVRKILEKVLTGATFPAGVPRSPEDALLDASYGWGRPLSRRLLGQWQAALPTQGQEEAAWRGPEDSADLSSGVREQIRVHFEAPPAARLAEELDCFLDWYNTEKDMDPVLKAGLAHFHLLCLRPFVGGNGFVARVLCRHALCRAEASPELYYSLWGRINREREAYFAVLKRCRKGGLDVTSWLRWFTDVLGWALDDAGVLLGPLLRGAAIRTHASRYPLNVRQLKVISLLLDNYTYKLSCGQYAKLAGVSHDTALRDINDLLLNRLLRPARGGGRSTAYEFVEPGSGG